MAGLTEMWRRICGRSSTNGIAPEMAKQATRKFWPSAISLALLLAMSGCGDANYESAQQEHERRDTELANLIENDVEADPQNPFQAAQTLTEDSMDAALGPNLDQTWVRMMVEHQEGAVRLADIVLRTKPPLAIAETAKKIRQDAHARIVALNARLESSLLTDEDAGDAFAPAISETFSNLVQAKGETIGHTWILKMSTYDRGGVALAGVEVTRGKDRQIKALAKEVASSLADEAEQLDQIARVKAISSNR